MENTFVLRLKPESQMVGFGIYAEKRHGRRIYFSDLQNAKQFRSQQDAKDWANRSINDFDIEKIELDEHGLTESDYYTCLTREG